MIRKILGILLAFSMIASSIGYHVVHHHCIWCGGDRVELISLSGGDGQEESCCHKDTEGSNDDCDEDACCLPGLLKLDHAVASEDGHHQIKVSCTTPIIHQYYLSFNSFEGLLTPLENSFSDHNVDPPMGKQAARLVAFRC